jgi:hypothetical protein
MFKPGTVINIRTFKLDDDERPYISNVEQFTIAGYTKAHPRARRLYEFQESTELRLTDAEIRLNARFGQ